MASSEAGAADSRRIAKLARLVAIVEAVAGSLLIGWLLVEDSLAERYASRHRPRLFFDGFERDLLSGDRGTFVVAHNAGDSLNEAREALRHGSDILEIDVVPFTGQLYAGHSEPQGRIATRWFRGPLLRDVLEATTEADAVQLDLKSSAGWYVDALVDLLNDEDLAGRRFMISARDPGTLAVLSERAPHALRALSIGEAHELAALRANPELAATLDGVTIRETLLDAEVAAWLREHSLFVNAWVVNDVCRANELIDLGVGAITTDNLALMQALGRPQQRDVDLVGAMRPAYQ